MEIKWGNFEKVDNRFYFEKEDGDAIDNREEKKGIRAYGSIMGKFLKLIHKAEKLEIDPGNGSPSQVFYVNKKSLVQWVASNKPHDFTTRTLEGFVQECLAQYRVEPQHQDGIAFRQVKGNLVLPQAFTNKNGRIATVNAANPEMEYGRGGLNKAFSNVIRKEDWNAAREKANIVGEGFGNLARNELLRTGQAADGPLLDNGMLLIHALGPDLNKVKIDDSNYKTLVLGPNGLREQVRAAYRNAFRLAGDKGYVNVQVPEISGGIFAEKLPPKLKTLWLADIRGALEDAIEDVRDDLKIEEVILVKLP